MYPDICKQPFNIWFLVKYQSVSWTAVPSGPLLVSHANLWPGECFWPFWATKWISVYLNISKYTTAKNHWNHRWRGWSSKRSASSYHVMGKCNKAVDCFVLRSHHQGYWCQKGQQVSENTYRRWQMGTSDPSLTVLVHILRWADTAEGNVRPSALPLNSWYGGCHPATQRCLNSPRDHREKSVCTLCVSALCVHVLLCTSTMPSNLHPRTSQHSTGHVGVQTFVLC